MTSKVAAREWVAWGIGLLSFGATVYGGWIVYHDGFASKEDVQAVRAEANANATATFLQVKNLQRGRLMSYEGVPEDQLTEVERKQRDIIRYDIQNIESIEQAVGLKTPTNTN